MQTAEGLDGRSVALSEYTGKVLLVTNVASACGYTEQNYQGLQRLYDRYRDQGFEVRQAPSEQGSGVGAAILWIKRLVAYGMRTFAACALLAGKCLALIRQWLTGKTSAASAVKCTIQAVPSLVMRREPWCSCRCWPGRATSLATRSRGTAARSASLSRAGAPLRL